MICLFVFISVTAYTSRILAHTILHDIFPVEMPVIFSYQLNAIQDIESLKQHQSFLM